MKGLSEIPSQKDLVQAYAAFQSGEKITENQFALFSQWARFDARLAEIWVTHFSKNWRSADPISFREALLDQPWPQAAGVLIEQVLSYGALAPTEKRMLRAISKALLHQVKPLPYQSYFIGLNPIASPSVRAAAERPLKSYSKWGFFGTDVLLNKSASKKFESASDLSKPLRQRILTELLKTSERITVQDYRDHLPGSVSLRTAQLDLSERSNLKAIGNTRARFYVKKRARTTPST